MIYIILYLSAIVLANLSVAYFGPPSMIINAFLFIGLDLTARDKLHEAWYRKGLILKMGLLIATGSILSWLLNRNAGMIAVASFSAFALAAISDTISYHFLRNKSWIIKINGSNVVGSFVDSIAFPTIAFGGFMPLVTLGQFVAKIFGGAIWALILRRKK